MLTDKNGLKWSISEDRTLLKCENGTEMIINPEWADISIEVMLQAPDSVIETSSQKTKELEDKVTMLEAQLAALISKLS